MQDEIGTLAGAIWNILNTKGELTLRKLKKEVGVTAMAFDWAIGWLAREGKIAITQEKRAFRVRLKEAHARAASPSYNHL
jgi:hypothetical protein